MSNRVTATNPESDFEIFVMNADGSRGRQITFSAFDDENITGRQEDRLPEGSRPGRRPCQLRHLHDEGRWFEPANRTNEPAIQDIDPNWSPNGRRIAFSSDRDGDIEIYTMRPALAQRATSRACSSGVRAVSTSALRGQRARSMPRAPATSLPVSRFALGRGRLAGDVADAAGGDPLEVDARPAVM
jgi:WD40-like Beta Propeller Repeat